MRLVFFGTAAFGIPALARLREAGHDLAGVVTAAPRPRGRGRRIVPSPIHDAATGFGLPVFTPPDPGAPDFIRTAAELAADAFIVVAYRFIITPALLEVPPRGSYGIHPSLLPHLRGPAPIQRALMAGETRTGVSIYRLDAQVDTGPVMAQVDCPVGPDETAGELGLRLAELGATLLAAVLEELAAGTARPQPQDRARASLAPKISKTERELDWHRSARELHDQVRALVPAPLAWTTFHGQRLEVLATRPADGDDCQPGRIRRADQALVVETGAGLLELQSVKPAGRYELAGDEFVRGYRPRVGEFLGQ